MCGGSGLVSSEVEAKVTRSNLAAQTSYYSGQSDAQKRVETENRNISSEASDRRWQATASAARRAAEAKAAESQRQTSPIEAARRLDAAARDAQTPAGKLALKMKEARPGMDLERAAKITAERAAADAQQAAKSITHWNSLWTPEARFKKRRF